ncbi:DEAD/DEAH box helicase [Sedimentibacter sp.]|uniref:DEAD/DEAH box helicase n=1 Tax=Sedimentibacter sp. TaxID=1960295 RepID=UPI00289A2C0B|nr:DEAD/DEAH box helicase [Sedimentibacter sp.]
MKFEDLNLIKEINKALKDEGYDNPTSIQEQAIPHVLKGRDVLGCAQTGTGKTAAFAIPIIQKIYEQKIKNSKNYIKALILTPTRELAVQIEESFRVYGRYTNLKYLSIFGGVSQNPQTEMLRRGVDVLIATPGRLNDLINQRQVNLQNVSMFVLDEADRMLDMGFIHDVKKIINVMPNKRQTLLFSATMPKEITDLVNTILVDYVKVVVTPVSSTVDNIKQYIYFTDKGNKKKLLVNLLKDTKINSALVFTRTKHEADKVVKDLIANKITAQAIHGDKSQGARQLALNNFKCRAIRVLVATDIAARGIDIDELSHVINYNLPEMPENYVHRIGRTGRAGHGGTAISLCEYEEKEYLTNIQKLIKKSITVVYENPYPMLITTVAPKSENSQKRQRMEIKEVKKVKKKKEIFKKSYANYAKGIV